MSTYFPKGVDILQRKWFVVDATGIPVGRLSTVVADVLSGKNKPTWTPFLDTGDHVIVINADKVVLTGRKLDQKFYRRHSGRPGGMKEVPARVMLATRPERAVEIAIKGMLPKNRLGRKMYTKLKVYSGATNNHEAQKPQPMRLIRSAE